MTEYEDLRQELSNLQQEVIELRSIIRRWGLPGGVDPIDGSPCPHSVVRFDGGSGVCLICDEPLD